MGCTHSRATATETVVQLEKGLSSVDTVFKKNTGIEKQQQPGAAGTDLTAAQITDNTLSSSSSTSSDTESNANRNNNRKVNPKKPIGHKDSLSSMVKDLTIDGSFHENVVKISAPSYGKPIEQIYDGVHDGLILGSGVTGIVRKVKHKKTGVEMAVKILDLGLIKAKDDNERIQSLNQLRDEIYIMCQLDHPNIVRLEEVYENQSEIYLVMELCKGGDVFDRLEKQPDDHYTEKQCSKLVKQMLKAVRYLHRKKIIHRDLKLENFLFSSSDPDLDSELRMIDFGLSKHFQYGEVHNEAVGTPYTVAPEVIQGSYDERCDMWSIGVITYLLLSGEAPFGGCYEDEQQIDVKRKILSGKFDFEPAYVWENVSDQAKDFVEKLLIVDYKKRPSAKELQKHPWLHGANDTDAENQGSVLNPKVVESLVAFKEYSDMRKLLCEVLSYKLLPEQIRELRTEFEILDTNGDGEISLEALKNVLMKNAEAGSLGALTEQEVEEIFNALRVQKEDPTIRWHEFIAAGLSQCEYDERNLRLAFDRLDSDSKGYITFENIIDLMGWSDSEHFKSKEADLLKVWTNSLHDCNKYDVDDRITYEDFVLLMKGQKTNRRNSSRILSPVLEEEVHRGSSEMKSDSFSDLPPPPPSGINRSTSLSGADVTVRKEGEKNVACNMNDGLRRPKLSSNGSNKQLYRAHREMRISVLAATKRFEEKKAKRDEAAAGLVFKRGSMDNMQKTIQVNKAKRLSGRCKRQRVSSDLTGLLL